MANFNKTSINTYQVRKLNISYLVRNMIIRENKKVCAKITFPDNSSIGIESDLTNKVPFLSLEYTISDKRTGGQTKYNYKIELYTQRSNLGKGHYYYFLCPKTGNKARILYLDYVGGYFQSIKAFDKNIYYRIQQCSKRYYSLERRNAIERTLSELKDKSVKSHYKGEQTKIKKRIEFYERELRKHSAILKTELDNIYAMFMSYQK